MRTYTIPLKNAFLSVYLSPCEKETPSRQHVSRRKEKERALSSNSATSKRSRDDFLKKKKREKRETI